jgi:hypothetical protein
MGSVILAGAAHVSVSAHLERFTKILMFILRSNTGYWWEPPSLPVHSADIIHHIEDVPARRPASPDTLNP